jgi:hypothetical protein
MGTENVEKMDEVFATERSKERVPAGEVVGLIGAVIRKAAASEDKELAETTATMQRAYLLTKQMEAWLASDSEDEHVDVPVELLAAVRKDAEGPDADVIPISEAMTTIGKRLKGEETTEPVQKGDDEEPVWGPDLAEDDPPEREDWGPDPAGLRR